MRERGFVTDCAGFVSEAKRVRIATDIRGREREGFEISVSRDRCCLYMWMRHEGIGFRSFFFFYSTEDFAFGNSSLMRVGRASESYGLVMDAIVTVDLGTPLLF